MRPQKGKTQNSDELDPGVCQVTDPHSKRDQVNNSTVDPVPSQITYTSVTLSNKNSHSCDTDGTFGNNDDDDVCGNIHPEKAKLNFYLLLMNGVRVVFTKALAFSTVLTIRGLLF